MIKKLIFSIFLLGPVLQAQEIDYSVSANLQAILSPEDGSPFWIYTNQRGRIDELTTVAGWATGTGTYTFRNGSFLKGSLGALYQDGYSDEVQLDEYLISFQNNWLQVYAGRKQRPELYGGLSATNESVLRSLNSRPLPGIGVEIIEPVMLWKRAGIGFMGSWEEFFSDEENRHIEFPRVHHKSLQLVFTTIKNVEFIAGVHHYVQWAGKSEEYGQLPSGLDNYFKVITGGSIVGGDGLVGEQEVNGLGNHLGGYELILNTSISDLNISLVYNTIFEDMSGIKLRNTPDGRYGIFIEVPDEIRWVEAFMYEYYFTRNQSKNYPTIDGKDNYFHNHLYRSGWTYEHRIIGLPFILLDENRSEIGHNNIVAHHIGLSGNAFLKYPYKFLGSYRGNYGVKAGTSKPVERIISTYLDVNVWQEYVNVNVQLGADLHSTESSSAGIGLRLSKTFF